jgi:Polysaccharide biosynthesis protein.
VDNLKGSRIIKNSALNLFNTFFMLATSWVISIWVARQLGPSNYGIFNLVLWLTDSFTWVIGMGLIHAITKFIAEYHGRNENECLGVIVVFVLKIELVFSLITMGILIWLRAPIAHYFFTPKQSIYFLIAFFGILPGLPPPSFRLL